MSTENEKNINSLIATAAVVAGWAIFFYFDNGIQWLGIAFVSYGAITGINQFTEMPYNIFLLISVITFMVSGFGVVLTGQDWIPWLSVIPFALGAFFFIGLVMEDRAGNAEQQIPDPSTTRQSEANTPIVKSDEVGEICKQAALFEKQKDYKNAFKLYKKAADMGDAEGLYKIGIFYDMGWGCTMDEKTGCLYLMKAAELGHAAAKAELKIN